jgi:hypothetical protein
LGVEFLRVPVGTIDARLSGAALNVTVLAFQHLRALIHALLLAGRGESTRLDRLAAGR